MRIIKDFLRPYDIRILNAIEKHWRDGRQNTGYMISPIKDDPYVQHILGYALDELDHIMGDDFWDAYILKYLNGSHIPPHKDDAGFGRSKHMRLNAMIRKPDSGGILTIDDQVIELDIGDAVVFTPSENVHSVSKVVGERWMFSVGCWI